MNSVLGLRCKDCNEVLSDFESDLLDLFDGLCEPCFEKNTQARNDILPDDILDNYFRGEE